MALIESLTLTIGNAVARSVLKLWLDSRTSTQHAGSSLTEIAEGAKMSFRERRAVLRNFERIAEEVGAKLAPYIEAEFRGLAPNELNAATLAAQETLDGAPLDDPTLFSTDLEPLKLEAVLRASKPYAATEARLSDQGVAVYDFVIREVANYIAEIIVSLPAFQSRAAREVLARETALISLTQEVLERLPDSGFSGLGDPERLEAQYRREVARKLDRLELFGVRTSELNKRYALSVAYIGLMASTKSGLFKEGQPRRKDDKRSKRVELSIEKVLSRGERHLIRGEAGSGKTTLLQWLAVSSARRSFNDNLDPWNGTVPFFIQLRRFVGESFPQPSDFVSLINRSVGERIPPAWAIQQMEQGSALVLVDGVDELREDERADAAEWLRDLVEAYPETRYVVTSRPPAVSDKWLDDIAFSPCFLEPMEIGAIDAFIEHWHDAARDNAADEDEQLELTQLAERLQMTVRENSQIRGLATSPLLCAMLCALNRDWKAQLPQDRVELYRVGLEMLLERRDLVREVGTDKLKISRQQKEVLLQGIAYWLLINGFSDAKTEDIENLLRDKVESMPRLDANPSDVLSHLLQRSGLIREPIEGRVDFIHRTFQEYLAARQVAEDRSVGLIVKHAAEDQWQEVVVLAAGLGNEKFSQKLIRALLDRAAEEGEIRHRLQLLAIASLETAPVLPKTIQDEINTVLKGLIPPRSMSEAKAIASAGEVAIPLLAQHYKGPVSTVAPSARSLGLIGGQSAMATLERFSTDGRVTVARELLRSWDYFPTEEYAQRVLRDSPLDRGKLTVSTAEQFSSTRHLKGLEDLTCFGRPIGKAMVWDWSTMASIPFLRRLEIHWSQGFTQLPWPRDGGKQLESLELHACSDLEELQLKDLTSLNTMRLLSNAGLKKIHGLDALASLTNVVIDRAPHLSGALRFPRNSEDIYLREIPLQNLNALRECDGLQTLSLVDLDNLLDLSAISQLPNLSLLLLEGVPHLRDLSPLKEMEALTSLELDQLDITSEAFNSLPEGLSRLTCVWGEKIDGIDGISRLSGLRELDLSDCPRIDDFSPISTLHQLEELTLIGCSGVTSLDFLRDLVALQELDLEGCRNLESLEPLNDLPHLQWVDLRGCPDYLDPGPLIDRGVAVRMGQAVSSRYFL